MPLSPLQRDAQAESSPFTQLGPNALSIITAQLRPRDKAAFILAAASHYQLVDSDYRPLHPKLLQAAEPPQPLGFLPRHTPENVAAEGQYSSLASRQRCQMVRYFYQQARWTNTEMRQAVHKEDRVGILAALQKGAALRLPASDALHWHPVYLLPSCREGDFIEQVMLHAKLQGITLNTPQTQPLRRTLFTMNEVGLDVMLRHGWSVTHELPTGPGEPEAASIVTEIIRHLIVHGRSYGQITEYLQRLATRGQALSPLFSTAALRHYLHTWPSKEAHRYGPNTSVHIPDVIAAFVQGGADPRHRGDASNGGRSLLHDAVRLDHPDVAEVVVATLLRHQAQPGAVDGKGRRPLRDALRLHNYGAARELMRYDSAAPEPASPLHPVHAALFANRP